MIKDNFFWFFSITIFPEKTQQNKITQSRDQDDFVLMTTIHKAKSPTQVHFRLKRDKRVFKKYKTSKQTLFEQLGSRRNIKSDPIAATRSDSNFERQDIGVD